MAARTKLIAKRSSKYLEGALYRRLFREGSAPARVRKELTLFLKSRKRVFKWEVGVSVRKLRERKRFRPALKLQETMARRGMNLTFSDHAIQLDLVAKSSGISAAEDYFVNLQEPAKNHLTYGALLNCYCKELNTEKAEALAKKMKELNFMCSPMAYNSLMTLYSKTGQAKRIPDIIREMKVNEILPDCYTYNIWMRGLAAMNDITGVERVIDEMKRDGRVPPDWTTYSNLASIYVDAGMHHKAEGALIELEKRNTPWSLEAYQFLITLYGRTGNLFEVHRIWRSLKLAFPKMANISYLNVIQVLVKLKDLPAAESIFKEWESHCSTYDMRVANALIGAYAAEDMIDKAEAIKKRAKKRGGRLNSKTWEIFMDYYFREGDMKKVLRCVDRGIKKGRSHARIWVPKHEIIVALMNYFEEQKAVNNAEKLIELLKKVQSELQTETFEALVRIYAAAGKKCPGMRRRLKMENVAVSHEMEMLLETVSVD
ncbi:Pentatricopeptide repeat-containing protein [Apostasia shenzhenica]|uniref:Pentatricopeptide repeat-containing protein n=1 Tax=Apostasia shenzhenica TaxID=1088818 RepID=A0A2H9ZSE7_9ASPA|nr:Pentatricopeptide repeat-containing protein [Apostasia shenzhenica]